MITTTTVSNEIKARVTDKLIECINKIQSRYGKTVSMPKVIFRQMGLKAGLANPSSHTIQLNTDYFNNGNCEDMINQTTPHEFAHLVDHILNGSQIEYYWRQRRSIHGPSWKRIMIVLGCDPDRCHTYNTDGVKIKGGTRHLYTCNCGKEFPLSSTLHNRVQSGQRRFCKACKSVIWLKSGPKPENISYMGGRRHSIFDISKKEINVPVELTNVVPVPAAEIEVPRDWKVKISFMKGCSVVVADTLLFFI